MNPKEPYAGQEQNKKIKVPARIAYKSPPYSFEEGCWSMPPYADIFYPGRVVVFPPPGRAHPSKQKPQPTVPYGGLQPLAPLRIGEGSHAYCAEVHGAATERDLRRITAKTVGGRPQCYAAQPLPA
jgi:hypothetical protein